MLLRNLLQGSTTRSEGQVVEDGIATQLVLLKVFLMLGKSFDGDEETRMLVRLWL